MRLMLQCRMFVVLFSLLRCSGSTSVAREQHFQLTPAGRNQCPSTGCAFQGLTTRSRIQCAAECDRTPKCSGFSYYASSRSCYLYDYLPTIFSFNSDCNFLQDVNAQFDSNYTAPASGMQNWIVIMHRFDGSLDFNRNWDDYRNGFGDKDRCQFWLGNEEVYNLTSRFNCSLRIEIQLESSGEWYYAEYSTFYLESENNKYTLRVSGYSGNAGDSLTNNSAETGRYLDGMSFSTRDSDNDRMLNYNCALVYSGGWWFNDCNYFYSCITCDYQNLFMWHWPVGNNFWPTSGFLRAARMMINCK